MLRRTDRARVPVPCRRSWQKVSALTPEEAQLEYIRLAHALLVRAHRAVACLCPGMIMIARRCHTHCAAQQGDNDVGGSSAEQPKTKRPAGFGAWRLRTVCAKLPASLTGLNNPSLPAGPVMSTLMGGCGSDVPSVQSSRPQGLEAAHAGVAAAASPASPTQLESARDAVIGAAREGDVRALALALAALPPPAGVNDVRSPGGVTPLMWAADGGHADAVQALLDAGADADAADDEGDTALQYAQGCGHEDIAQLLATRTL